MSEEGYFGQRQLIALAEFWHQSRFCLKAKWDGVSNVKDAVTQAKRGALHRRFKAHEEPSVLCAIKLELEFYTVLEQSVTDATGWDDLAKIVNTEVDRLKAACRTVV